jgi:hypothetical protein
MSLSAIVAWMLGRGSAVVVESNAPQAEITKRAMNEIAEQRAAHFGQSMARRMGDQFRSAGRAGYVDGGWNGTRLNLWWHSAGSSAGLAANLRVTFEQRADGGGTRTSAQARLAPMFLAACSGVAGIGLLTVLIGAVLVAFGSGVLVLVIGAILLAASVSASLQFRIRLRSDLAPLWQFLNDCGVSDVGSDMTGGTN